MVTCLEQWSKLTVQAGIKFMKASYVSIAEIVF